MDNGNGGARFVYFMAGLGVGALLGILFAPQSGEETREMIAGKSGEGRDCLSRKGRDLREQAADYVERGKDVLTKQRDHLTAAIEAGKQAYRSESQSRGASE